jgi:hypothetical protein
VEKLNSVNATTLNIAGNGIYTMRDAGWNQEEVDVMTYRVLKGIVESPNLINKIVSIRSGGQTGFDEAGAKAGIKLGIPTTILAPKGWKFRNESGTDISNEQAFKARFASTQPSINITLIALTNSQRFTRKSVENDSEYMYLFTDNAKRTSGSNLIPDESRYSAVYGQGNKYPTTTQAVIRGLDNAFPITTMVDDKRTQWTDDKFEEFKQEIDSEIAMIKGSISNFKGIKFSAEMPFGKGAISNMKNTAPNIWNYLNSKLAELGIDNTGDIPVSTQPSTTNNLEDTEFEVTKCRED